MHGQPHIRRYESSSVWCSDAEEQLWTFQRVTVLSSADSRWKQDTRLKCQLLLTYELFANCCQARLAVVTNTTPFRVHSAPTTGGISGTLISWCCPALPAINIEFLGHPWVFLPWTAFLLFGIGSRHEELERELSVLSGPILQALAHKVSFVCDHHPSYQAQIVQQSASFLNLCCKKIFLYHLIGVKCYNVINHVPSVLMEYLMHFRTLLSVCLLLLRCWLFERRCLNSIFLSSNF